MATDVNALVSRIDARLREAGTPERAEQERRYLKSSIGHYGVTVWQARRIVREELAGSDAAAREAVALAEALWAPGPDGPVFDRRRAAVEALDRCRGSLTPADLVTVERLIRESGTWALVDDLAADVTGHIALRHPSEVGAVLDRWSQDGLFWVRRSSLLALLPAIRADRDADLVALDAYGRLETYADRMLSETEFFIRKAIGWVLRDAGRRKPEWVAAYVASRQDRMAGLTRREAVKRLPPELLPAGR